MSHTHQIPHVGFPHIDPVIIARAVNKRPIGAILVQIILKYLILKIKFKIVKNAMDEKQISAIHEDGT